MSKNKPTIIKDHGGFPMVVPAIRLNMAHAEIANLRHALEKACEYLVQEDVCMQKAGPTLAPCPLDKDGQELSCKECWQLYLKQE